MLLSFIISRRTSAIWRRASAFGFEFGQGLFGRCDLPTSERRGWPWRSAFEAVVLRFAQGAGSATGIIFVGHHGVFYSWFLIGTGQEATFRVDLNGGLCQPRLNTA